MDEAEEHSITDSEALADLLLHWSEEYHQGREIPAEELCRNRPELIKEAAILIKRLKTFKEFGNSTSEGGVAAGEDEGSKAQGRTEDTLHKAGDEPWEGYSLIERLGQGGFGEVWSARREGVLYALKIIKPIKESHLQIERNGLSQMSGVIHPFVLRPYLYWIKNESLIIITELADGSLEQHFSKLRPSTPLISLCAQAARFLRDAADALDYFVMQKSMMHLDIKPANMLIAGGRCKLCDFGSVRPITRSGDHEVILSSRTQEDSDEVKTTPYRSLDAVPWEQALGAEATLYTAEGAWTPHYAAPERFIGKFSKSSDQYSLALTFCELVAGKIPFPAGKLPRITDRREGLVNLDFLPMEVRHSIWKALAPSPEDRFSTCLEFVGALREALLPLVEDEEAKRFLTDVEDGGRWVGNEEKSASTGDDKSSERLVPNDAPSESSVLPQESIEEEKKTRPVGFRMAKVLIGTALLPLKAWFVLDSFVEGFKEVETRQTFRADPWRGKVILFVLVVCLAVIPSVILAKRMEWLTPTISRWFISEK